MLGKIYKKAKKYLVCRQKSLEADNDFKFQYDESFYSNLGSKDIETIPKSGFNIGLIGDVRINEFFNL